MASKSTYKKYPVEDFFSIKTVFSPRISPDGKTIVYVSNKSGYFNIWRTPAQGGEKTQITYQKNFINSIEWTKSGDGLIFSTDYNGNENWELYYLRIKDNDVRNLTGNRECQVFQGQISPDDCYIAYSTNSRKPDRFDTFIMNFRSGEKKCLHQRSEQGIDGVSDWSPCSKFLIINRFNTNYDSDLYLLEISTGELKYLTPHTGKVRFYHGLFNKDSSRIYFVSDLDDDFINIWSMDCGGGDMRVELKTGHDIEWFHLSPRRNYLNYALNVDGESIPHVMRISDGNELPVTCNKGIYGPFNFSDREDRYVHYFSGPVSPSEIRSVDARSSVSTKVTDSLPGHMDSRDFVEPESVRYRSFDGEEIHGFLYIPHGVEKNGANPAVLMPHGGPNAQSENFFDMYIQILCNRGLIVFTPNFRGSTGYGKRFMAKIYRDWGGGEFRDLLEGVNFLKGTGYVDEKRIGVMGGSFGGYATLNCMVNAPDLWACGVDLFGPANLMTFIKNGPPSWVESSYDIVGHPERDGELLMARSPIFYIENCKAPLLVVQGANDPRVPKSESDEIVRRLKEKGKIVEYLLFDDEGHGIAKDENRKIMYDAILQFLTKYLKLE